MQYSEVGMLPRGWLESVNTHIAAKDNSHARGTGNILERAMRHLIGGQDLHLKSPRTGGPERHRPNPPPSTFSDQLRRTRIETHCSESQATGISNWFLWSNFDDNWFLNKWLPIRCSQFRRKNTPKRKPKWRMNWVSYAPNHRSAAPFRGGSESSPQTGSLPGTSSYTRNQKNGRLAISESGLRGEGTRTQSSPSIT